MKCPKCFAICADTDLACYTCKTSLGGSSVGEGAGNQLAGRIATIFACLGACIAPLVADANFPQRPKPRGINWQQVHAAGIGGAIGGGFGFLVGMLIPRKKEM